MSAALHATADDLAAKGATGRERVKRLHDAERNAGSILEAIRSTRSDPSFGLSD
jgi:hypothetical protein